MRPDGTLAGHGTGGAELLGTVTRTRPAGRLLALVPARLLDRVYAAVAQHRDALGRLVPDGEAPRRAP